MHFSRKKSWKSIGLLMSVVTILFAVVPTQAQAAECSWTGPSSEWTQEGYWSCGHIPNADDDVIIDSTVTVTLPASTTVNSVVLGNVGGSSSPILVFSYDAIANGALTVDSGNIELFSGSTVTHANGTDSEIGKVNLVVQSGQLIIHTSASVNANSRGYVGVSVNAANGNGPGKGLGSGLDAGGTGAGHGGIGAGWSAVYVGGDYYGNLINPSTYGSSGGGGNNMCCGRKSGNGGGAIRVEVTAGNLQLDGSITANGEAYGGRGGGGSGGSINIITHGITGSGTITANGGNGYDATRSGAGGRIALKYSGFNTHLGGISATQAGNAENGTVYIVDTANNNLLVEDSQIWRITPGVLDGSFSFGDVVVEDNAQLKLVGYYTTNEDDVGFDFEVRNLRIEAGSLIDGNGGGFKGGYAAQNGFGPGGSTHPGTQSGVTSGAGYGGNGGQGWLTSTIGYAYGSESASTPDYLGSGSAGGGGTGSGCYGGNGGSALKIQAIESITIDGTLRMDGTDGCNMASDRRGGGGSGGSVYLITQDLLGGGLISANGGNGGGGTAGAGAGGRVAVHFADKSEFTGQITSNPGASGAVAGSADIVQVGVPKILSLWQKKLDGSTDITLGDSTDESTVILQVSMTDGDATDTLTPEFEIQPISASFTNIANVTGSPVEYSASEVVGQGEASGLTDLEEYHWQARTCDANGNCSPWLSYGENEESVADFTIFLNQAPNLPSSLGPSTLVGQGYTRLAVPTFSFALSDGDQANQVKYQFQLSATSNFDSPLIDYTSALQAQGSGSFALGQSAGEGSYAAGADITSLNTNSSYYWRVKAIDEFEASSDWSVASGTPAFTVDLDKPGAAAEPKMKRVAAEQNFITDDSNEVWINSLAPLFSWTASSDTGGSNLKGYCLYLGTDENGDPASQKGLLGSSPVSATGSTCQFIVNSNEIDLASTALRGNPWIVSSTSPYYLSAKAIDNANNVSEASTQFRFYFDNATPTNVKAISAASGSFSNIADMYFNWPTNVSQGASDVHSGVLGFQYAFNSTITWKGSETDANTGLDYIPPAYSQPYYLSDAVDGDQLVVGSNTIYVRTIDKAGNISPTYSTALVNYGGEAPSFAFDAAVTVTPTSSDTNNFALSWSAANPAPDRTVTTYYYMVNTLPPATLTTITQNSAVYHSTTSTSVAETVLSGVRKGSNTVYVLSIDDNDNYSPSNYISANFTLDSDLPDPPSNLTAADSSVKSASIWRSSLAWDVPDYQGTGSLSYTIQRSTDGSTWTDISTTSGTAYVDTVASSQAYYWRVGTTDTSDDSIAAPSYANAVALTPKGKYTDPASLTSGPAASSITTKRAKITWTTSRTSDSRVAYGTSSGSYFDDEISNSTHITDHEINLSNLQPGTTYYYKVKWIDEDGNIGESEEKSFSTSPAPVVSDVQVRSVGLSTAILEFTSKGATKAKIYYGTSLDFGGSTNVSTSAVESTYTVELSELSDATKYFYKINTFDSEDDEYEGTVLDFTTLPRPRVSNVRIQQVKNTAQSTLSVSWESNTEISSIVTYYPEGKPEFAQDEVDVKLSADQHEMMITGLLPDTAYILVVRGRDKIGNEAVSDSLKFTTATDTRPPLLSNVYVEGTSLNVSQNQDNPSQLIVSWTTDEPATSQVEFGEGTGDSYSQLSLEDSKLSYNHVVIIPNLGSSKVYHLRAISKDMVGNEARSVDTVTITPKATDNAFELVITSLREAFGFLGGLTQ